MEPNAVAIYARVSTADQTCKTQLRELREYASRRGWPIAVPGSIDIDLLERFSN